MPKETDKSTDDSQDNEAEIDAQSVNVHNVDERVGPYATASPREVVTALRHAGWM